MLSRKLDKGLSVIISFAIAFSFLVVVFVTFVPKGIFLHSMFLSMLIIASMVSFFRFICIVIKLSRLSIESNVEEIDEKTKADLEAQHKINEIYRHTFKK
ncbi:MAG: hypothetical protein FWE21_00450 [Defluviitaleaceae bacterium]|nr:hypothetical protein [Defluviitaleaceae bacterium]